LLAVNGTTCTSVKQASNLLVNALKSTGIVILVERPVEPAAVAFVRAVLLVNKKNVMDPKMPDDVVAICGRARGRGGRMLDPICNAPSQRCFGRPLSHFPGISRIMPILQIVSTCCAKLAYDGTTTSFALTTARSVILA
uniref:PDZ domain-containing protein n=1 Tax=Heligmosomoides polygyrus TaxID=6339 RepID=A0A183F4J1_HELPZ